MLTGHAFLNGSCFNHRTLWLSRVCFSLTLFFGHDVWQQWERVILDEAHSIKNRTTSYFKSCAALSARHRWCLTGTPLQYSLDDLFALFCFLHFEVACTCLARRQPQDR